MKRSQRVLLYLVRASVMGRLDKVIPDNVCWDLVMQLAMNQGVIAIANDAMELLPREKRPSKRQLMFWTGYSNNIEVRYKKYYEELRNLAKFYEENDIKMLLMKGYGLSLNYPICNHRPPGDIDIFCYDDYKRANEIIAKKGIEIDYSHHKHSVFTYGETMVENHHSFLNVHGHKSTKEIEDILHQNLEGTKDVEMPNVIYPNCKFNSLYLLRHSAEHFASVDLNLRTVLDWGFFVRRCQQETCTDKIDWNWLLEVLDKVGMKEYLAVTNEICMKYLGFDRNLFPSLNVDDKLVERSICDILKPEVESESHKNVVKEILFRFKRWKANKWKYNMVFKEPMWQSLITQLWSHILKPAL